MQSSGGSKSFGHSVLCPATALHTLSASALAASIPAAASRLEGDEDVADTRCDTHRHRTLHRRADEIERDTALLRPIPERWPARLHCVWGYLNVSCLVL